MSVGGGIAGGYGETSTDSEKKIEYHPVQPAEGLAQDQMYNAILPAQAEQFQRAAKKTKAYDESDYFRLVREAERQALQNQYDRASGRSPILSPEEQALLDEYYGNMQRTGLADIQKFAQQQAAARGFSVSDSPIYDESGRQAQELIRGLSADKAGQAYQVRSQNAAFNEGLQKFQSQLRQQAWNNRLALGTTPTAAHQYELGSFAARMGAPVNITGNTDTSSWNVSGNVSAGTTMGCWVAAALYGYGTPEFWAARHFIFTRWKGRTADLARRTYMRVGPAVAWAVTHVPGVRALLKPLFDVAVRRGR